MKEQPKKTESRGIGHFKPTRASKAGTNYLLSIAIDDYQHFPKLHNCVKDASDIVNLLLSKYQFEEDRVFTLYNEEATTDNIFQQFEMLAELIRPEDSLVIYFAGHGEYKEVFDEGYWIPVNATSKKTSQFIPNSEIKTMLTAIETKHTFLIADSCFSGSLFARGAFRSIADRVERYPSRWGLTSGRSEIVTDGLPGVNSPFASSILYLLKHNLKELGVQELCTHVIESVAATAIQTPIGEPLIIPGHKGGQFVFRLKKDEKRDWFATQKKNNLAAYETFASLYPSSQYFQEATEKVNQLKEEKLWEEVKEENTIRSYFVYKDQYPNGKYVDQVIERIEDLEEEREWKRACQQNRIAAFLKYKRNFPKGNYTKEADEKIETLEQIEEAVSDDGGLHANIKITKKEKHHSEEKVKEPVHAFKLNIGNNYSQQPTYEHKSTPGNNSTRSRLIMFGIPILIIGFFVLSKIFVTISEPVSIETKDPTIENKIDETSENPLIEKEGNYLAGETLEETSKVGEKTDPKETTDAGKPPAKIELKTEVKPTKPKSNNNTTTNPKTNEVQKDPIITSPQLPASVLALKRMMVNVRAGKFVMGNESRSDAPLHVVNITRRFAISKRETTQELWQTVMGNNPSFKKCRQCPVENVSFYEVQDFFEKLNRMTGQKFRLPTEAEWEYAAIAGQINDMNYQNVSSLPSNAYFKGNAQSTKKVAQKNPNKLGLHDMLGNVAEWCLDWYDEDFYQPEMKNPYNRNKGVAASKVIRGGSFLSNEEKCSVYYRSAMSPNQHKKYIGFRIVLD